MTYDAIERRLTRRSQSVSEHGIASALVRPGINASVVDVSAGGTLIETHHRLLPGSSIEIYFGQDKRLPAVRGRVLRCSVAHLEAGLIRYRGAVLFDRHLPWLSVETGFGVFSSQPGTAVEADETGTCYPFVSVRAASRPCF
jgi:hypothetical protein